MERVRFQIRLSQFQEHKRKWELIENFNKLVQHGRETGILKMFDAVQDLTPETDTSREGVLESYQWCH